jgi:exonuclease III
MSNDEEAKEKFYKDLDSAISTVPQRKKLIILGDFNARVETDYHAWDGANGKHGVAKCNISGLLILRTCNVHDLHQHNVSSTQLPENFIDTSTLKAQASTRLYYC